MILEIFKYGFMILVAVAQVFIVGLFLLGFWNGFTYEAGKKGSKYHFWFTLLPFKRFFKKKPKFDSDTELWVRGAVSATFKGYSDWIHSDKCRIRNRYTLDDVTDNVEIYSLDKDVDSLLKTIQAKLYEYGIKWDIKHWEDADKK